MNTLAERVEAADWFAEKDRLDRISLEQGQINDPMERIIAEALTAAGFAFKMEDHPDRRGNGPTLDFDLGGGLYIEAKRMHTPRVEKQLAQADNIILVQGKAAAEWFAAILRARQDTQGEVT